MEQPQDHKQIGQRLDLFHFQEEAPGMVFWHRRGLALVRVLEEVIRKRVAGDGFEEVRTPQLVRRPIWAASGHWEHFREHMYVLGGEEGREDALKPVNCPCHVQIVERMAPSYRDLPIRLAEFGVVHRAEDSGALSGLFRLRQFTQDDGHIFCAPEQVEQEVLSFCASLRVLYEAFGFQEVSVAMSTRPAQRAGDDALWDRAEAALAEASRQAGLNPVLQPGQGAFYGPKLEFALRDRLGRVWQCGTIQLDFVMPGRFGLTYVDSSGGRAEPVMVHRAILGSLERFIAILLEHYDGVLPSWLAPDQVAVLPISDAQVGYASEVMGRLRAAGLRVGRIGGGMTLSRAIVEAHGSGIHLLGIVGRREVEARALAVRGADGKQVTLPLDEAIDEIARRCQVSIP
jgi:threonyl-tRNA synthetase